MRECSFKPSKPAARVSPVVVAAVAVVRIAATATSQATRTGQPLRERLCKRVGGMWVRGYGWLIISIEWVRRRGGEGVESRGIPGFDYFLCIYYMSIYKQKRGDLIQDMHT